MASTSPWAALYFVALMTFGNYVLFNLLVAILVEGFQAEVRTTCWFLHTMLDSVSLICLMKHIIFLACKFKALRVTWWFIFENECTLSYRSLFLCWRTTQKISFRLSVIFSHFCSGVLVFWRGSVEEMHTSILLSRCTAYCTVLCPPARIRSTRHILHLFSVLLSTASILQTIETIAQKNRFILIVALMSGQQSKDLCLILNSISHSQPCAVWGPCFAVN